MKASARFHRSSWQPASYSAVASHQDQIYSRDFTVESGVDRDIEVRLTDLIQPETDTGTLREITGAPMQP